VLFGAAVDDASGDVYLADSSNDVIDRYSASGVFQKQFKAEAPAGSFAPGSFHPSGVAVDQSTGDLYVADETHGVIDEFTPEGVFVEEVGAGQLTNPVGVAVDGKGDVYVANGDTLKFTAPAGKATVGSVIDSGAGSGVAVEPSSEAVYVDGGSYIAAYTSAGVSLGRFGSKQLSGSYGVAVYGVTHIVYAVDANSDTVYAYELGETPEEAPHTTEPPGEITTTSAKLEGELNPGGAKGALEYRFDYNLGTSCTGGQSIPVPAVKVAEAKEAAVEATATNLEPNAQYTYCLVALNPFGELQGNEVPFETLKVPPTAKTEPATSVKTTEARLEGLVNPNNQSTKCEFQYGTEASLATSTTKACEPETLTGFSEQGVGLTVSGLTQNTKYYYRAIAENAAHEKAEGTIEHFTTPIHPETPEKLSANPIAATEATLHGALNPKAAGNPGSYEFLYKASATQCEGGASSGGSALGDSEEAVKAEITGLIPNTEYTFCLRAHNEAGEESAVSSPVTFTTPPLAPEIVSESSSGVSATEARLEAEINPGNSETAYHFEYGPAAGSYDVSVPVPDADIHAGLTGVSVSEVATGLAPSTTYHYRVVAANALPGVVDGPDQTFTTLASVGTGSPPNCSNEQLRTEQPFGLLLPDCRAYEQVSPVDRNGYDIFLPGPGGEAEDLVRASVSGEAITYVSFGSFADPAGARFLSRYVSRRGAGGWSTQNITPPYSSERSSLESPYETLVFTPDLSMGVVRNEDPLTSEAPGGENLYLADIANGSYQWVGQGVSEPEVQGASTDLSHIVFSQSRHGGALLDWVGGQLSKVDVANDGSTISADPGGVGDYGVSIMKQDRWHAVSADGLRVFFTDTEGGTADYLQLYVRENPEQPQSELNAEEKCTEPSDACTVEVSASQKTNGSGPGGTDPHGPQLTEYLGASVDGSKVFFDSRAELTNNANTGSADNAANLYEYDLKSGVLTDLTLDAGEPEGAAVLGMVTAAQDGSYVYYVADGVLAAGAAPGNCAAHPNESPPGATCNLYVQHYDGTEWTPPVFIATLAGGDSEDWLKGGQIAGEGIGGPANNTARITPDGAHLAFLSEKSPPGYDNTDVNTGKADQEVFSYDATQPVSPDNPICVSCNPSGARPVGPSRLSEIENAASPFYYTPRNFSEDGSRLFFDSRDALVPHASNGRQNVYEYEGGHVYLISDGAGSYDSSFLDASPSGDDVFIATADRLVPQDQDSQVDVYDARVGGGFPVSVSPPACDNGDSCKGPVSPQPSVFGPPASATFSGAGNLAPVVAVKPVAKAKPKPETRAQKLKKALKACKKLKKKTKRLACERQANKNYGPVKKKAKRSSTHSKKGRN
jgi:hypothetical protein